MDIRKNISDRKLLALKQIPQNRSIPVIFGHCQGVLVATAGGVTAWREL